MSTRPDVDASSDNLALALAFLKANPEARIFPARKYENGEHKSYVKWGRASSSDPEQAQAWAKQWPACYFCIDLVRSPYVGLDPDDKDGRDGNKTLSRLESEYGALPGTCHYKTTSGKGQRFVFKSGETIKTGADRLGEGLDIPVMTPLPGQTVPGKGQYGEASTLQCAGLPDWVSSLAGNKGEKSPKAGDVLVNANTVDVAEGAAWLVHEAPRCERGSRDDTTYKVAAHLRDRYGFDYPTCLRLMTGVWADDGWTEGDIDRVLTKSVYGGNTLYGQGEHHPNNLFKKGDPAFGLISVGDLLSREWSEEWLVDRVIPLRGWTGVIGLWKNGKTFITLDMACHIALGLPWRGMMHVEQGPVLYVAGEGHVGLKKRFAAWQKFHGHRLDAAPIAVSKVAATFDDRASALEVKAALDAQAEAWGRPPVAVFIDTLARNMGGDENKTADMNQFIRNVDSVLGLNVAKIIVHHVGHGDKSRGRGASSLPGALDAEYLISKYENGFDMKCTNIKESQHPAAMAWQWREVEVWRGVPKGRTEETSITSLALMPVDASMIAPALKELSGPRAQLMDLLKELDPFQHDGVPLDDLADVAAKRKLYTRKRKAAETIKDLADKGYLTVDSAGIVRVTFS
ncbi:AAA family ATPase [Pseudodesulfovibrio sp.]|uniref:AAA family ATPase n=1 Tax=Pseudodesulfovibrio sp. TaxID=2035812 RepID=UPI0026018F8A|nr:AAA family ATPase [Pseudodesulfovibrio sp.]MDD3313188.1 AAA family ATPase [Pseudodesulfovibrio sp.]